VLNPTDWIWVMQIAAGLGMVIFVHELGHFAVAKWCGVKCEKFYLGFDIYGLKLFKKQWGETEYGIGILPLGGYVKMLGQDDNPSNQASENARSRSAHANVPHGDLPPEPSSDMPVQHDPRSYLAQTVPERMAIISAGVIMNVIFAFAMSAWAYSVGVEEPPCTLGSVVPGGAAWRAGMRGGDEVVRINDIENPRFKDLKISVILANGDVNFTVKRPGVSDLLRFHIAPDQGELQQLIGVTNALTTTFGETKEHKTSVWPAWDPELSKELQKGDQIVAVDGAPVQTDADLDRELAKHPGAITLTVKRSAKDANGKETKAEDAKEITVKVPARPMKEVGFTMEIGPITGLQAKSPAEAAGVRIGDIITKVDGQAVGDPLSLPDRLLPRGGETVRLTLLRDKETVEVSIPSVVAYGDTHAVMEDGPVGIPTLGLAYSVLNRIQTVEPRLEGKLKPGDEVIAVQATDLLTWPDSGEDAKSKTIEFKDKKYWANIVYSLLPRASKNTKLELTLKGDRKVTIEPFDSESWMNPDRGFILTPQLMTVRAHSVGELFTLAGRQTKEDLTQVYGILRQLFTGRLSYKNLGGIGSIVHAAGVTASAGLVPFLLFLSMLSANLAVINFLPIPVLDGGHMVFLTLEAIRRKPVSERVVIAFQYAGLAFILLLVVFVNLLDVQKWLTRN
jgi:regulator of sigma E protease